MTDQSVFDDIVATRVRFLSKTIRCANGCLEWSGANGRYGSFVHNGRYFRAHRASWILFVGEIPDGLMVLHKCDNRPCVEISHLFLGNHTDNAMDMVSKGRHGKGPNAPGKSKPLKPTALGLLVRRTRIERGLTVTALAAACELSRQSVTYVESGAYRSVHPSTLRSLAEALDLRLLDLLVATLETGAADE